MQIDLTGRTALVTGGSRGLGRAVAERLMRSGAEVIILARRPEVLAQTVAEVSAAQGRRLHGIACDVADPAALASALSDIARAHGTVDILVNNAGTSARRPIAELDPALFQSDMDQKVTAAIRLIQWALPGMRAQRWGRIVNVVSIFGKTPQAASAPTSVSRAAGIALTKAVSLELAPHAITVNALCIGYIDSDQWRRKHESGAADGSYDDYLAREGRAVPMGRLGRAEELANVACFLASDAASYVTGTAINVDGGLAAVT